MKKIIDITDRSHTTDGDKGIKMKISKKKVNESAESDSEVKVIAINSVNPKPQAKEKKSKRDEIYRMKGMGNTLGLYSQACFSIENEYKEKKREYKISKNSKEKKEIKNELRSLKQKINNVLTDVQKFVENARSSLEQSYN
uniref:Uncharacterized protein n=1 Tax=viral metagenome TaxID=1070528 RepID=A0A6C0E0X7_9ZZZZ